MLDRPLHVDAVSGVNDFLGPMATSEFRDFGQVCVEHGAMYIIGRDQAQKHTEIIRDLASNHHCQIIYCNPTEGSETLLGSVQCYTGFADLIDQGKIWVIGCGAVGRPWRQFHYDHWLYSQAQDQYALTSCRRRQEIYDKQIKPYTFLMYNSRLRTHRKWLLAKFRHTGLLDRALWSCLQRQQQRQGGLSLEINGHEVISQPEEIHYLPPQYEPEPFREQISKTSDARTMKDHLYNGLWGEIMVSAEPYIDTYFSLVTETAFQYPYSFRTEKIWKPIMMGHPWICVANRGFYKDLRALGFRTFDGIIDESFDDIDSPQARIERLSDLVHDLCNDDLVSFMLACQDVCKYNQEHFFQVFDSIPNRFINDFTQFVRDNSQ